MSAPPDTIASLKNAEHLRLITISCRVLFPDQVLLEASPK
jgi:hypothetical protein